MLFLFPPNVPQASPISHLSAIMEGCIMFRMLLRCSAPEQLIGNTGAEIRLAAVSQLWNYFASTISNGIPAVTLLPSG